MSSTAAQSLKDFCLPDYNGGSIVNLLSGIIRSRGGRSPHSSLKGLPTVEMKRAKNVVCLVVDGLGVPQLEAALNKGKGKRFFAVHPWRRITTVFPATTASAVTTFATGATPAEHAILGWHAHLPDLGVVSAILPVVGKTGMAILPDDYDLEAYLALPSHLNTTKCRRELLSYGEIPSSRYSQAGTKWRRRRSFATLEGLVRHTAAFAGGRGRGFAYVYWPKYDSIGHEKGCNSRAAARHLEEIDAALGALVRRLAGSDTMLCVTSDHGMVDAGEGRGIDLMSVPGLAACLAIVPSGDARQVSCFVRPAQENRFREIVRKRLPHACVCIAGADLIDAGAYGPGREHASFRSRLGDYILLAKDNYCFTAVVPGKEVRFNVGNHGGMSKAEIEVPLYVVSC